MGLSFNNLGTSPNQSTFTQDVASATKLLTSGPFGIDLTQSIYESSAMIRSGLLAQDARLNNITGVIAEMPFAAPLNYEEEEVNSSNSWGKNKQGYYTIQKTQASTQYSPFVTRGAAFGMDDLSQVQTGFDALASIRSQLSRDMDRKITAKVLAQLKGLFGVGTSGNAGALAAHTVATTGTTPGDGKGPLTATTITKAKALLGERGHDMDVLFVHPDIRFHLEDLGMTIFEGQPGGTINYASQGIGVTNTEIGYFAGLRVISDSQLKPDADGIHTCYLAKSGTIRTGSQFPLKLETERNILSLQDTLAVTYSRIDHVIGTSWVAGAYASDPSNDDLAEADHWIAAFSDTRLIPLVQIKCSSGDFASIPANAWQKHPSVVQKGDGSVPVDEPSSAKKGDGGPGTVSAGDPFPSPTSVEPKGGTRTKKSS